MTNMACLLIGFCCTGDADGGMTAVNRMIVMIGCVILVMD